MASKRSAVKYVVVDWGHWGIDAQPAGKLILEGEVSEGGTLQATGFWTQEQKSQRCWARGRSSVPLVSTTQHLRYFFITVSDHHSRNTMLWRTAKPLPLLAKKLNSWCVELVFLRGARSTTDVREAMSNSPKFMISLELTIDSCLVQDCKIQARLSDAPYQLMFPYQRLDTKKRANFETICIQTRQ